MQASVSSYGMVRSYCVRHKIYQDRKRQDPLLFLLVSSLLAHCSYRFSPKFLTNYFVQGILGGETPAMSSCTLCDLNQGIYSGDEPFPYFFRKLSKHVCGATFVRSDAVTQQSRVRVQESSQGCHMTALQPSADDFVR